MYLYIEAYEGAGKFGVPEETLIALFEEDAIQLLVGGFAEGDLRWAKKPEVTARDKKGRPTAIDGGDVRTANAWERFSRDTYVPPLNR
jgi:hypothetical protein